MVVDRGRYENHKPQSHEELQLIVPSPKNSEMNFKTKCNLCVKRGEGEMKIPSGHQKEHATIKTQQQNKRKTKARKHWCLRSPF